jgi:hypothetical protein
MFQQTRVAGSHVELNMLGASSPYLTPDLILVTRSGASNALVVNSGRFPTSDPRKALRLVVPRAGNPRAGLVAPGLATRNSGVDRILWNSLNSSRTELRYPYVKPEDVFRDSAARCRRETSIAVKVRRSHISWA